MIAALKNTLVTLIGVFIGMVAAVGGLDNLESVWFPVAGPTTGGITTMTGKRVCWYIEFERKRPRAKNVFFSWFLERPNGRRIYLSQEPMDGQTLGRNQNYIAGFQKRSFCANLPERAGDMSKAKLIGRGEYEPWHGMWELKRRVGPFT